ncbi:hypothetical protein ABZU76_13945 [Amycolatopsis sp. NPDC005232]|uniref:hypothetical protein n=1 Tax=Amycolatopsis sp. NPDC005232 TaxID=3157027 RepID=UPI0033B0EBD4
MTDLEPNPPHVKGLTPEVVDFPAWLEANEESLRPPVNKKVFLLPRNVRHSPQRPPGTLGLVVEHVRPEGLRRRASGTAATATT